MSDRSTGTDGAPAKPAYLRPVTSGYQIPADTEDRPMLSLGGSQAVTLKTFTISASMRGRSLVDDNDFTPDELAEILDTASRLKRMHKRGEAHSYLAGKTLAMIFQHPSTRTRVSFEAGMTQLGGHALYLGMNDLQLRRGETVADTAKVISRYTDVILARVVSHDDIVELGANATVPVINGLSDKFHPTQAVADMLTLREQFGSLKGLRLAYLGDGNNICASLILQGAAHGLHVVVASPKAYQPSPEIVTQASWLAAAAGGSITVTDDPLAAAKGADAVYTDVHVSMGMQDSAARAVALAPYKVTPAIMAEAGPKAIFMHDLPMHRDEEVAAEVADGPQSVIFDQAENRMHAHKALLMHMLC
ncbi:MAG TPA: ornithine carbamoyltransferase [Thermomicrobiales bacterium]|nr:ornithine carbamoyltransferase [Thermomicrobiales bacterium]